MKQQLKDALPKNTGCHSDDQRADRQSQMAALMLPLPISTKQNHLTELQRDSPLYPSVLFCFVRLRLWCQKISTESKMNIWCVWWLFASHETNGHTSWMSRPDHL
ncbi:hypothetical protein AMECASPLE_028272 [Ameca splendens]|uniref:Uncharacterized protein n=1 Tax=Ameca splendens TaxID=208324 RepID=A0ABV0Y565_9TELE